jgi:putative oxidoreductase
MNLNYHLTNNAHWLLRIAIVSVFLFHGALKFSNLDGFANMLPISYVQVVWVALANVGSVLLLAGGLGKTRIWDLATRIGAAFNIPVMFGAIYLVHWGRWNFVPTDTHPLGGMEFQVILILVMLYFVIIGNGDDNVVDHKPAAV